MRSAIAYAEVSEDILNPYAAGGLFKLNKRPETLEDGYSSESSNEYQHGRV